MKKVSLFGIIAFVLLSLNAFWQFYQQIKAYSALKEHDFEGVIEGTDPVSWLLISGIALVANILLLCFFIGLYRKQK